MSVRYIKNYRLTVRLSDALRRRLKDSAWRNGTRESEIVRGALERQFAADDEELTAYERAGKAGLIGVVRGANRDLSTKPKYFDGFGR
jgi:predicted transcriptional regulator